MAKSAFCFISIIIGIAIVLNPGNLFGAEKSEVIIELKFNKKKYTYGEPIGAKVAMFNKSGRDLLLSRGFSAIDFFLEMRIIDPTGRLIIARQHKPHDEFPDAPPLPFILYEEKPVRAVPCEVLQADAKRIVANEDIGNHYSLERPGKYSAQVQISAAIFKDEPCHTKNYQLLGVFKSNTVHFNVEPVDKKKQTAALLSPFRNLTQEEKMAINRQSIQSEADTKIIKASASKPSHALNANLALELLPAVQNRLTASNHQPFTIRLVQGGGRGIPTADMTLPVQAIDVAVNTAIEVDVSNAGSNKVVKMYVLGTEVYNTEASDPDAAYPHTQRVDIDSSTFTLIYQDPQTDFSNCQQVDVVVKAYRKRRPNRQSTSNFNFQTICLTANDTDGDGISDAIEMDLLHTDPSLKTLFVRPKHEIGFLNYTYWKKFIFDPHQALFPWAGRPGFADIAPFRNAGIEVSVIGDPGNPYEPMREFTYDPAADANHPPCDILEIVIKRDTSYCSYHQANEGHTFFTGFTWSWDTKGYTPNNPSSSHYLKYHYFQAIIYPFPLENYFKEGAYGKIQIGQQPILGSPGCGYAQCWEFNHCSPMNVNQADPVNGPPDATVEINNEITFNSPNGQITYIGNFGTPDDRDTVLRRTIVHEMGHTLLAAFGSDHCSDPKCIMYHSVADWKLWDFGPPDNLIPPRACTHSSGKIKDIRATGVVHNSVH